MRAFWLACCVIGISPVAHAQDMSFADALARAAQSPSVEAGRAGRLAADRAVGPAGQLPDPQLVLGLENVPVEGPDAYRFDRDFMTMRTVGIMQDMPSGAERRARRQMAEADVVRADAMLGVAELEARLGAAQAWFGVHYAERRLAALQSIQTEATALAAASRARLAGGAGSANDAIAAEIDAARMRDRLADAEAALAAERAELRRWTGEGAITGEAPAFHVKGDELRAQLAAHPVLAAFFAEETASEAGLDMARAERAPDWSLSLMYQNRERDFGDMASVEVRIGLPLFQAWRQGPLIESRRAEQARAQGERAAALRAQRAALETALAQYAALDANLARARDTRLPLARQRAEAVRGSFAAGAASTADVIAARREAVEAELELIDLEERRALVGAALTLPFTENAP
ncbi:MAG: TolC family protein [Hyphomonadaceae bacterium]|nr:TolC family protein [Hyphomonadaceae bacterium]